MLADFEQHMKNIENDVNNNSRNLTDIIDSDLRLKSSISVIFELHAFVFLAFVVLKSSLMWKKKDDLLNR